MNRLRYFVLLICCVAITFAAFAQERYADHSVLSSGLWVKVRVKNEGVYQLTKADLQKMGFTNPDKVKLYGYNIPVLPEANIENLDDDLTEMPVLRKSDGTMLFYSFGTTEWTLSRQSNGMSVVPYFTHKENPYSSYLYYFLTEDASSEPKALDKSEASSADGSMATFLSHSLIEKDEFSFINSGRTFFESYDFRNGSVRNYTVPMPGVVSSDVTLTVQFAAAGKASSTLDISCGAEKIATLKFDKLADYIYGDVRNTTATWTDVSSEEPKLRLEHNAAAGISGHLDYIRATYERKLNIGKEGYLAFCAANSKNSYSATLTGANEHTHVLRVTSPSLTVEYPGEYADGNYTAVVTPSEKGGDTYVAINANSTFPTPETVGSIANQDLHAIADVDLVIITPASGVLNAEAQRLADAHTEKDSMRCVVVQADHIYNEFSSGTPDATAYRRFLKMLYDKSGGKGPKNLLLFGRGAWDNRMATSSMKGQNPENYLLCYESDNSVSHTESYVLEEYFTLLADGKGASPLKDAPDCGVGRLPVGTVSEARVVVNKLIRYMQGAEYGSWLNTICFLADDGNANQHGDDEEAVWASTSSLYPDYRYKKIYWDSYEAVKSSTGTSFPAAYAEINKVVAEGALIMNYAGHGAAYCLSHEQVLKTADFQGWNSPRLPLWLTAACDVMPFDMNTTNLGVEAVMNPSGGAMGFIGTARTVYPQQNKAINTLFMQNVLGVKDDGERFSIGEALAQAKAEIASNRRATRRDLINKAHFVLVGDPAIKLPTPELKVKIDKINGLDADAVENMTISAGETITVEGHVENAEGIDETYTGIISPTLLDCIETIVCKDNDGSVADAPAENGEPKKPLQYQDRTRVLFTGTDSIRSGRFTVTFPVPLDISYANDKGLFTFFALNDSNTVYAQGTFDNFLLGGTAEGALNDTIGPEITAYLTSPTTVGNIALTNETPVLYATLRDSSGISINGAGLGHDITAIIDNNEFTIYTLNSYYTPNNGDYRSGSLKFTIPALSAGAHTLTLRAFDTFNNMSEATVAFKVVEGLQPEVEYFDFMGRKVNADNGRTLPSGIYIRRMRWVAPEGVVSEQSEKVVVTQ